MGRYLSYSWLLLVLVGAYFLSRENYLLFHSSVELFSVVVSATVFMLVWTSRKKIGANAFVLLGVVYLFVGVLDFFHTLSYKGMNIFPSDIFYANQLWVCARLMESLALLTFAFWIGRPFRVDFRWLFAGMAALTAGLLGWVFVLKSFPTCFVQGSGQTLFKIVCEYVICLILFVALITLLRRRQTLAKQVYGYLVASIAVTILSEFCFTLYTDNYGLMNLFGHLLKIVAFYLIYRCILVVGIEEPFTIIYSDLERLARELEAILDHIPGPVFHKDDKNRFIKVNKYLADTYRQNKQALENKSMYDLYPYELAKKYHDDDLAVLASGRPLLDIDERWETPNGLRWVSTSKIPFVDANGKSAGIIGISIDVTERRAAEQQVAELLREKELILKEVHHRIKNNLSTVYAMLTMQAEPLAGTPAQQHLLDAANRVVSMSLLYEKIYQSENVQEVSVRDYLPALLDQVVSNFPNAQNVRVECSVQDFKVKPKVAQNLGIIYNELLTNIMKYAFTGRSEGLIQFTATCVSGQVRLVLQDDGVGLPQRSSASPTGFGLALVETMVKGLGGTCTVTSSAGTLFTIEFAVAQ